MKTTFVLALSALALWHADGSALRVIPEKQDELEAAVECSEELED